MIFLQIFFFFYSVNAIFGFPTNTTRYGYQQLTPDQIKRLKEWTKDNPQNKWELSGQYQGDMIIQPNQRNGRVDPAFRWPRNEVPYIISDKYTQAEEDHIVRSIESFNSLSCVNVRRATSSDTYGVVVTPSFGCMSWVGYQGRFQELYLAQDDIGSGCLQTGSIQHEFLHALGFHHMHSDSDRDDYITIMTENIIPGLENNFIKYTSSQVTSFGEPYDYGSVLHYDAYAGSRNGQKTIVTKDLTAEIGQREGPSSIDINKLNKMYDCPLKF